MYEVCLLVFGSDRVRCVSRRSRLGRFLCCSAPEIRILENVSKFIFLDFIFLGIWRELKLRSAAVFFHDRIRAGRTATA